VNAEGLTMKTIIVLAFAVVLRGAGDLHTHVDQTGGKPFDGLVIRNVTIISAERAEALQFV
jgi:hypothetical protein